MTREEVEATLNRLRADWPTPSVVESVMTRIESQPAAVPRRPRIQRWRAAILAVAAMLAVSVAVPWFLVLATPPTLYAQMQQAFAKARTAHVVVASVNEKGVRQTGEIWYQRGNGFRADLPEGIVLDDGTQEWTWRPATNQGELTVVRRASRNAVSMITGMFQLSEVPMSWLRQAPEHDRAIEGRDCKGYIVTPPAPPVDSAVARDLHPPRIVVLTDADGRIVRLEEQRRVKGQWHVGREVSIAFDVEVPVGKLALNLPAGALVIDADRVLEERSPLDQAVARTEAGGLLFAIHELVRGEDETFYVVSSVRGTPEYLKQHPPQRRRWNLEQSALGVAEQPTAAGNGLDCGRAVLAYAEREGVHYLWWVAVPNRYFSVEQGKRVPRNDIVAPPLEVRPGVVRLPLQARYRDARADHSWVGVRVEASLPGDKHVHTFAEIASRARRDVLQTLELPPLAVVMLFAEGSHRGMAPDQTTDAELAGGLNRQIEWLRSLGRISPPSAGISTPGAGPAPPLGTPR